jgi:hypothetical protein
MRTAAAAWSWGDARGGESGDHACRYDTEATGHGDGTADDGGQRVDGDQRRDAGVLPDRVQRRAEGQDDQELRQGRADQDVPARPSRREYLPGR